MVRSYDGHAGQVSSIQFRPLHAPSAPVPDIHIRAEATETAEGTSPLEVELEAELAQTMDTDGPTSDVPPTDEHDAILDSDGENEERADKDNDNDSRFGEQDESMAEARVDGSGEAADASGDSDLDADGEADLFDGEDTKPEGDDSDDTPQLPTPAPAKTPAGLSLALPGQQRPDVKKEDAPGASPPRAAPKPAAAAAPVMPKTNVKQLPKPMFGSMSMPWQYDADVSRFSSDIVLTSTLSGQVLLWDRRVDSKARAGVRALPLPPNTPPWCMSVCWNHAGDRIYVGRRNETVDEWDVRMLPDVTHPERGAASPASPSGQAPHMLQSLRLPRGSGPVSAVSMMPNDRHIVCASFDNVRLWDTHADPRTDVPFKIVAGHHGGTISQMLVDERAQFLLTSSGDRGWFSTSTETLLLHEILVL